MTAVVGCGSAAQNTETHNEKTWRPDRTCISPGLPGIEMYRKCDLQHHCSRLEEGSCMSHWSFLSILWILSKEGGPDYKNHRMRVSRVSRVSDTRPRPSDRNGRAVDDRLFLFKVFTKCLLNWLQPSIASGGSAVPRSTQRFKLSFKQLSASFSTCGRCSIAWSGKTYWDTDGFTSTASMAARHSFTCQISISLCHAVSMSCISHLFIPKVPKCLEVLETETFPIGNISN